MSGRTRPHALSRRRFILGAAAAAGTIGTAAHAGIGRVLDAATTDTQARRVGTPMRRRWNTETIGTSVEGRPIVMHSNVAERPRFTLLLVSAIHGDERGAGSVGEQLVRVPMPDGVSCYGVPIANPDGWARGTRNNANDVDLNRNFPWGWLAIDGGSGPLGEPESRAIAHVVEGIRPSLAVFIHQPLRFVAPISAQAAPFATTWAAAAGIPVRYDVQQHGGAETWCARSVGCASMLVEGTTRDATVGEVDSHIRGFEALLLSI